MVSSQCVCIWIIYSISIWASTHFSPVAGDDDKAPPPPAVQPGEPPKEETPAGNPPPAAGQSDELLKKHYEALYAMYSDKQITLEDDCRRDSTTLEKDKKNHRHWGTKDTLKFLIGQMPSSEMTDAEKLMMPYLGRLRLFLARIGYLKDPGSLLFLIRQQPTLRMVACQTNAGWRQQGATEGMDKKFQEKGLQGEKLGIQAPNSQNYIHKYTCYTVNAKKCSHTFYVITKPLPDVPTGLQVREGGDVTAEDAFSCGVQYCKLKQCVAPDGDKAPRRSYPPYEIMWKVPEKMRKRVKLDENTLISKNFDQTKLNAIGMNITWDNKIRKSKDAPVHSEEAKAEEFKNAFGDDTDAGKSTLHSRIEIKGAEEDLHGGLYECVIVDGNGVVSMPNQKIEERAYEYLGDANIHVMPQWLLFGTYGATVAFILLTLFIVLVCPAKLEHDDGSKYKKDEMVEPTVVAAAPAPTKSQSKSIKTKSSKTK